ncbi:MAG: hypothetical protein AB8B71_08355 [Paracoccaceae bacterium]
MARLFFALITLLALSACSVDGLKDLDGPAVPLGDFNLGHNIVVAPKAFKGPLSRNATEEELTKGLQKAIAARFDRYEGARLYHFGVSVEGYVLAAPGIPLVYSPKSLMIINVTVWDDAAGVKLNEKPEQLTIFESLSGETLLSSGLTQSKEEQLKNLNVNAAKQIELFLVRQRRDADWFAPSTAAEIAEESIVSEGG